MSTRTVSNWEHSGRTRNWSRPSRIRLCQKCLGTRERFSFELGPMLPVPASASDAVGTLGEFYWHTTLILRLMIGWRTWAGLPDRVQLQQVLMNLMLNGIQAMPETGGVLTIKSQLDQDGRVLISVSDTGVGLPSEKADQIFDAFFTTKPEGSGMDLAISRSIVESHGGRLWATPNDGRGTSFHFSLPTATAAEASAKAG